MNLSTAETSLPAWQGVQTPQADVGERRVDAAGLLAQLRQRDRAALAMIVRQYASLLTRTAYLHLGDGHAAEDVTQETFVAAWDSAQRTTADTDLQAWLTGILLNRCRRHWRTLTRRRTREAAAAGHLRLHVEDPAPVADDLEDLRLALEALDPDHRDVLILRYFQGLSVQEASQVLGIPEGTVKSRTAAAMARLRQRMKDTA